MRTHHKAHRGKAGHEGKGRDRRARGEERFAKYDADGNGSLSAAEVAGTKMESRFAKLDANGDGAVTRAEMRAAKKDRKGKKSKGDEEARKSAERDGKQASRATQRGGKKAFAKR